MTETEATIAAIFTEAGWKPNWRAPNDVSRLTFSQDCGGSWNVGGIAPDGVMRWKNTSLAPDSPDTPDDPVEAARVLVRVVSESLAIPKDEEIVSRETDEQHSPEPAAQELGQDILAAEAKSAGEQDQEAGQPVDETTSAEPPGEGIGEDGEFDASSSDESDETLDADFTEFGGALETEDLAALALEAPEEPDPVATGVDSGGVAYFGDNLHVIRLAKIGRVTQIAYERKAALQAGWTLDRFAFLQNLVVRIDRGEAPDDQEAKAEFEALTADLSKRGEITKQPTTQVRAVAVRR